MSTHVIATLDIARKIYKDVFLQQEKAFGEQYDPLYARMTVKESTDQEYERFKSIAPIGLAEEVPEGNAVAYKGFAKLYQADYYPVMLRVATAVTLQAARTDQGGILRKIPAQHVRALENAREKRFIDTFINRGFNASYTGMDGVTLYNTAHPQGTGPTWSNRPTAAALSSVTLGTAKELLRSRVDPVNVPMPYTGELMLVTGPNLSHTAAQILASTQVPENANNGANVYRKDVNSYRWSPWITDTNAWFLWPTDPEVCGFHMLTGTPRGAKVWEDENTLRTIWAAHEEYVYFWTHANHTIGNEGA